MQLLARASDIAHAIDNASERAVTLGEVVVALAQHGQLERAETLARTIDHAPQQAAALREVAAVAVQAGDHETAQRLLADAETTARTISGASQRTSTLGLKYSGRIAASIRPVLEV